MTISNSIRIAKESFGFGDAREVRKVLSLPWKVETRELESFVERQNPYTDPWLTRHNARLLLHEEEAQITLPSGASEATVAEASQILLHLAAQLTFPARDR